MKPLDRITVCNEDRKHELGSGKLSIGAKYARIHVPGDPSTTLPDKDIHAMAIIGSRDGDVVYSGDIWDVAQANTPVGSKVKIHALPAEEHDGNAQTLP